jgi:serine/threonine-protein kinase HipA
MSKLNVFYEDFKVGVLERNEDLVYSFQYQEEWLKNPKRFPLSLAMPLQEESFGNRVTLSFFENLLPEGEVRDAIARGHSVESSYEFLKEFGKDCAGAVIITESEISPFKKGSSSKLEIDMEKVYAAIEENQSVADVVADMEPGYLSLAGAQDKFAAIYEDGKFYLPQNGAPSTHIVKVPIRRSGIKESVQNEYFCMQLAKAIGLNIPHCQISGEGIHHLFVIERYDRYKDSKGKYHRLHQQDFCQAQGVVSEEKYEIKGGPSIKNNYDLIIQNVNIRKRLENVYAFLDWICFNLMIGNNDSHSKNISLLHKDGKIELAPMYDLICTAIYPKLQRQFSFMIGDRDDPFRIGRNQFELMDKQLGLKIGTMTERMRIINGKVMGQKDEVAKTILSEHRGAKIVERISDLINDRSNALAQQGVL